MQLYGAVFMLAAVRFPDSCGVLSGCLGIGGHEAQQALRLRRVSTTLRQIFTEFSELFM
jgi:hypothetical protein